MKVFTGSPTEDKPELHLALRETKGGIKLVAVDSNGQQLAHLIDFKDMGQIKAHNYITKRIEAYSHSLPLDSNGRLIFSTGVKVGAL